MVYVGVSFPILYINVVSEGVIMDKSRFFNISGKDIRRVEVKFNNGESFIIPRSKLKKLDINLTSVVDVIDSPIFKHGFLFSEGSIEVDKLFLQQMLGDNIYDRLQYRNGVNSLVIQYNNDYKIKSDIPLMFCLVETTADAEEITKLKYEDNEDAFSIKWIPIGAL